MLNRLRKEPAHSNSTVFYDLDKIQAQTVEFRLHGKTFRIRPLSASQFFEYTHAYQEFHDLAVRDSLTPEELRRGYFNVFSAVCPEMTEKDVETCSQQQAAVIFGIILDAVTGKEDPSELKKKAFTIPKLRG